MVCGVRNNNLCVETNIFYKWLALWKYILQDFFCLLKKICKKYFYFSIFFGIFAVPVLKGAVKCIQARLPYRGEVIPSKLTRQEQDIVRRKFGSYCITVLHGEAMEYLEELEKQRKRETNFSELLLEEKNQLFFHDDMEMETYFPVMNLHVPVKNELISNAIARLPEKKRLIILMAYFLDMTEKEIAEYMDLVQSTVHYHKADSLRLLKKLME